MSHVWLGSLLFIQINPVELNYYPFMISLDNYNGNCNVVDDLSTKICVPSEIRYVNVTLFNMITKLNEAKTLVKLFHAIVNANSIAQHVIQIKIETMINVM